MKLRFLWDEHREIWWCWPQQSENVVWMTFYIHPEPLIPAYPFRVESTVNTLPRKCHTREFEIYWKRRKAAA